MNAIKLNCPSCGGSLELPDNLTVAHCLYCGTRILLDHNKSVDEHRDLSRLVELCKVAVEAKNHAEVYEYCNRILELDPNNVDAWTTKAQATFWLSTVENNRYNEAIEYLNKAAEIAPQDARIPNIREALRQQQAWWLNNLGQQTWKAAGQFWKSIADSSITLYALQVADERSKPQFIAAMEYFLSASSYAPENTNILVNIEGLANDAKFVQWSERVYNRINILEKLRTKKNALDNLPKLREELRNAQSDLARLRTQSGFLVGGKIRDVERRIARLTADIAKLEQAASYNPLKVG